MIQDLRCQHRANIAKVLQHVVGHQCWKHVAKHVIILSNRSIKSVHLSNK